MLLDLIRHMQNGPEAGKKERPPGHKKRKHKGTVNCHLILNS